MPTAGMPGRYPTIGDILKIVIAKTRTKAGATDLIELLNPNFGK